MANNERMQALGQHEVLKKQIYDLGIKAQSLNESIQEEANTFLFTDKDFVTIDYVKIETLAKELQQLQNDYKEKVARIKVLKDTYNF